MIIGSRESWKLASRPLSVSMFQTPSISNITVCLHFWHPTFLLMRRRKRGRRRRWKNGRRKFHHVPSVFYTQRYKRNQSWSSFPCRRLANWFTFPCPLKRGESHDLHFTKIQQTFQESLPIHDLYSIPLNVWWLLSTRPISISNFKLLFSNVRNQLVNSYDLSAERVSPRFSTFSTYSFQSRR